MASAKQDAIFFVAAKCFVGYSETPKWRRAPGFAGYPMKQRSWPVKATAAEGTAPGPLGFLRGTRETSNRRCSVAGYPMKQVTAGAVSSGKALHNKLLTKYSNSVSFMKVSYIKVSHNQVRLKLKITVDFCKVIIYNKYIR